MLPIGGSNCGDVEVVICDWSGRHGLPINFAGTAEPEQMEALAMIQGMEMISLLHRSCQVFVWNLTVRYIGG